jgi:hypothetical protein
VGAARATLPYCVRSADLSAGCAAPSHSGQLLAEQLHLPRRITPDPVAETGLASLWRTSDGGLRWLRAAA